MVANKTHIENLFLPVTIGLVFPVLLFLVGWWGSILFIPEVQIKFFALSGLLAGILLDVLFLKRWIQNAFICPLIFPALIYLFYSVCSFGFLMGVPILNVLLGPVGGYYMYMRLREQGVGVEMGERTARRTALFTAFILSAACFASITLAFLDQSLSANIQGIFRLQAPPRKDLIMGFSAVVAVVLVWIEYVVTRVVVRIGKLAVPES